MPLGPLRYNERKERDLGGKQELQIPSARSPAWSTLLEPPPMSEEAAQNLELTEVDVPTLGDLGSVEVW